jgi:hypothetical protein
LLIKTATIITFKLKDSEIVSTPLFGQTKIIKHLRWGRFPNFFSGEFGTRIVKEVSQYLHINIMHIAIIEVY